MQDFDVVILGGGPGGTQAAQVLAQGGQTVAVVEDKHWGGTCLNCGCVPTKMLLGAVAPGAQIKALERLRLAQGQVEVNFQALHQRLKRFVQGSSQVLVKNLQNMGITLITGHGQCVGPGQVQVQKEEELISLSAKQIILACGSRPATPAALAHDGHCVLNSTELLQLQSIPSSLIIIGGGAIGLELGDFFAAMGTKVTLVEGAEHILPTEDRDIAQELAKAWTKAGRVVVQGSLAQSLVTENNQAVLTLADGTIYQAEKALLAVGRSPNTHNLGATQAGCVLNPQGFVEVNSYLEAAPGVYAVGDINGQVLLAHAAEHQGAYVARRILGQDLDPYLSGPIPACVYGSVEVIRVGSTAGEAAQRSPQITMSQAPLSANVLAQSTGQIAGFVKAVWDGQHLVGMAAVGPNVSHLVTAAQLLVLEAYCRIDEFMFAHPTLDEALAAALKAPRSVYK